MNQKKIGEFILKCRREKALTQLELAEMLGVSDRSISNWENGRNMPDLSLFKPLCEILGISINDLMSGEKVSDIEYQDKLEENIIKTIDYSNKKVIEKNNLINIIFIVFGTLIVISSMTIFPSESSWGSIYSILGGLISLIGIYRFTKRYNYVKRVILNILYIVILNISLLFIDYISVVNIKQAPRFSIYKITSENTIYYDTLFYDVIRCNRDTNDEYYKVMSNINYDKDNIDKYCK